MSPSGSTGRSCSGNVFGVFGLRPALGRLLGPADDRTPGGHPVAVIAHDYWRRRFGGYRRRARHDHPDRRSRCTEVIGVAPEGFTGTEPGRSADLFVPAVMNVEALDKPGWGWFRLWVRPRDGVSIGTVGEILQADQRREQDEALRQIPPDALQRIDAHPEAARRAAAGDGRRLAAEEAVPAAAARARRARRRGAAHRLRQRRQPPERPGAVAAPRDGAAGGDRRRPLAPRAADAGRERAARDLRLVGGAVFGWWAAPFVVSMLSSEQEPMRLALGVDWRSTAFGIGLTVLVTVLFGTLPALRASAVAPGDALRSGGRVTSHRRLTRALIGAQAAFCVFVVFVAVLLATTFARLSTHPLGFRADRLLVVNAEAPPTPAGATRGGSRPPRKSARCPASSRSRSRPGRCSSATGGART